MKGQDEWTRRGSLRLAGVSAIAAGAGWLMSHIVVSLRRILREYWWSVARRPAIILQIRAFGGWRMPSNPGKLAYINRRSCNWSWLTPQDLRPGLKQ